jgi:hypothetical protein
MEHQDPRLREERECQRMERQESLLKQMDQWVKVVRISEILAPLQKVVEKMAER